MRALLKRRQVYVQKHKLSRLRRRVISVGSSFFVLLVVTLLVFRLSPYAHTTRSAKTVAPVESIQAAHSAGSYKKLPAKSPSSTLGATTTDDAIEDKPIIASCSKPLANTKPTGIEPQRTLFTYRQMLCSGVLSSTMLYVDMPTTSAQAEEEATVLYAQLKVLADADILPYVVVEPKNNNAPLELDNLQKTTAASAFESLLTSLKKQGLSDADAGTWVLFPLPNIPLWSTLSPSVFTTNYTSFGTIFREYFPNGTLSVLLDSSTYTENSFASGGTYASLSPYLSNLPTGMVETLGFQGFPWVPPADSKEATNEVAADFLNATFATEAARTLDIKDVWVSSGSFANYYTQNKAITRTAAQRAEVLEGISEQISLMQKAGLHVSMQLLVSASFNEASWSYQRGTAESDGQQEAVFTNFAETLRSMGVPLGVFSQN